MADWDKADSFVTHRKSLANLRQIRKAGLASFAREQKVRMRVLEELINRYDDGRSKSFYCLAAALLPPAEMKGSITRLTKDSHLNQLAPREGARMIREAFERIASKERIDLAYRRGAATSVRP